MTTNEEAARNLLEHLNDTSIVTWQVAWDQYRDAKAEEHILEQRRNVA